MRSRVVAVCWLVILASCSGGDADTTPEPAETTATSPAPPTTATVIEQAPVALVPIDRPRSPLADDVVYMVMTDRFANGDEGNDFGDDPTGGSQDGDVLRHGFDPTRTGYYHGGDLVGLTDRLDYLQGLGITALWLTPILRNRPVQGDGTIDGSSASYHGYWQLDFTEIDPHLGTAADFQALVDEAHRRSMKVIVDVVVNHTADVISYGTQSDRYQATTVAPYLDASGTAFDVRAVAGTDRFPPLDPDVSFPLRPETSGPVKAPAFLNDLTNYHNRGQSTFSGESSQFGDFFGLDDLFTEKPDVVAGMIEVHRDLIERFGVDGFRVDTAKHVNDEFWAQWLPAMVEAGGDDFAIFGEVVEPAPDALSRYMTDVAFPSVIDMRMDDAVERFAAVGAATTELAELFVGDDWFIDGDSGPHDQVTVVSSHDFGRLGGAIDRAGRGELDDAERVARMRLGLAVQFLSRGTPIVYYGDEQGFAAVGDDRAVREDMFASSTPEYQAIDTIGSDATPADDNFDPEHPLYLIIGELAAIRRGHQALRTGPQTVVASSDQEGIIAWTRRGDDGIEYLIALNNSTDPATAEATMLTPGAILAQVHGSTIDALITGPTGEVTIELDPLEVGVWIADRPARALSVPEELAVEQISGASIFGRDVELALTGDLQAPALVVFEQSTDGETWVLIGMDDGPPYRVFTDPDDVDGTPRYRATVVIDDEPVLIVE